MPNNSPDTKKQIDTRKLTAWYNFQAPFYHFWRTDYNTPLVEHIADLLACDPNGTILDAGCGSGLYSIGLGLSHPKRRIVGVDLSGNLLRIARGQAAKHGLENISFANAPVGALPYHAGQFRAIIAAGLFPNLEHPRGALQEFSRVLHADGQFIIVEFDRESFDWKTRLLFSVLISGYHAVTTVFTQYRFAQEWNIATSSIDPGAFADLLVNAGFSIQRVDRKYQHIIYTCRKV